MKKTVLLLVLIFLILGFISNIPSTEENMCTKMDLECQKTGEYTVNECTSSKSIFGFWIINIAKQCPGKELVTCQDNTQISSRIEIDRDKCKYSLTFI